MPYKDKAKQLKSSRDSRRRKRQREGPKIRSIDSYYRVTKEHRKQVAKEWKLKYLQEKPQKRLIWAARKRAKNRGLEFDIQESDIIVPDVCPYLGIKLVPHVPRGQSRTNCISLDRIDNQKGYIKGNVQVISHLANTMKSNASEEQLKSFATKILANDIRGS